MSVLADPAPGRFAIPKPGPVPICLVSRDLQDAEKVAAVKVVGATPMLEWVDSDTTVFSY